MKRIFTLLFLLVLLVAEQTNAQTETRMHVARRINNATVEKSVPPITVVSSTPDYTVTPTNTTTAGATLLAQTLAGPGVTVSNASLKCGTTYSTVTGTYTSHGTTYNTVSSGSTGYGAGVFSYSGSTLGMSNGIVLTTGLAANAFGPAVNAGTNGEVNNSLDIYTNSSFTNTNLTSIQSTAVNDVCILTFQFVPICNSISITYEFGSSEYNGYECSTYNDAFGLFLAGPNPAGGNYAVHHNVAVLPGTTTAVSINNINDGTHDENTVFGSTGAGTSCHGVASNPSYYQPNYTGSDIAYQGLTTAITSTAAVTPCQTYTMEIAIGDAGDENYDSGVFLKSNALSCPSNVASATSPANCGGSTGSASVTVTNYTGTPTYTWSPGGQHTSSISNQAAGTYTCAVGLTQCGTVYTETITAVISPTTTPITVSVNSATICSGGTTTLTASGATNYTWSPSTGLSGTTGSVVTANPTSTQTYTVKGALGTCTNSATSVVTVHTATTSVTSSTICAGQQTATLTAAGASTYTWTGGTITGNTTSSPTVSPTTTTVYTVNATAANTCTATATGTINVISTPTISVNSGAICKGQTSLTLTATSNAGTFVWSPATGLSATTGSTVVANPTSTQNYTIVGTAGTCTVSTTTTVTVNNTPTLTTTSGTICLGQQTGTVTVSGASTYTWTGGGVTGNHTTNPMDNPGSTTIYTVNGTDVHTCTATATGTITVNTPPTLTVTSNSICNGAGPATLGVSGASTYTWSGGGITGSHSTAPSDNPVSTTIYTVNGTDAHTCTATATGTINVISTPTISVNSGAICKGQTSLTLTATSNATSFVWSPSTGLSATTGSAVVSTPTSTQSYTILGTAGTCTVSTTTTVTVHNTPTVTTTSSTICAGQQTATLTATGASTYTWTGGTITGNTTSSPTATPTTTTVYTVNASDVNTCTTTTAATITVNAPPALTVTSDAICNGAGPATLGVSGASTYTWTGGGITGSNSTAPSDNPAVPTTYTVNGTDAHTCTATATGMINVISTPTISVNSGAICKGQTSLTLTANSNAASFVWSPATGLSTTTGTVVVATPTTTQSYIVIGTAGTCTVSTTATVTVNTPPTLTTISSTICLGQQTGTVTVSGANTYTWTGESITGNTTNNPTDNPMSLTVYTVNAADINTCTATATATITVNTPPTLTVTSASICNGAGPASLGVIGASTYTWTGGGITGSNSITPSDNPSITTIYTVSGTDAHTCTATATGTINIIGTPTISVNNGAICKGQTSLTLTASSNASTFVWSPTTGLSATSGSMVVANPTSTQTYTIIGTANTCTVSTTITVTVNNTPTLNTTSSTICLGQQTGTVTVNGANTYTWTGGSITGNHAANPTDNPSSLTIYTVNATDVNTCTATATASITVNNPATISVNSPTVCAGETATLTATGVVTYSWTAGLSSSNGASVTGNPTSTTSYTVSGSDINTCTNTAVSTINVISNPTITVTGGAICSGQTTFSLIATSNASSFSWSPATGLSTTSGSMVVANPTSTQTYTIVGAAGSCTVSTVSTITVNTPPVATASTNIPCETETQLNLNCTVVPTAGAYTYNWSGPNSFTANIANPSISSLTDITQALIGGTYSVLVTDINGCTNTSVVTVTVNPKPTITATGATVCVGQTINISAAGGGVGGSYTWNGPSTYTTAIAAGANPSIVNSNTLMTGIYSVIGHDGTTGCYNDAFVLVQVNVLPIISISNSGPMCVTQTTTTLIATSTNAGTNYTWAPTTGLSSATGSVVVANPFLAGTYTYIVTGTDVNSCIGTSTTSVLVNPTPTITATSAVICVGQQTATLTASSTNANTTFSWNPSTGLSASTGSVVTGNPTSTQGYVVTGIDANFCYGSTVSTITVNNLPIVTANSATICIGKQATLTANGANTYTWNPSASLNTSAGNIVIASPTITTTYVVSGTDVNTCTNTTTAIVHVNDLPNVVVVETATAICIGNQDALTASGASTYTWTPAVGLNTTHGNSVSASPSDPLTVYTVTATDIFTCVNTATTSVTVYALPIVSINPISPECVPYCPAIQANSFPTATSFAWDFGNQAQLSGTLNPAASLITARPCYTAAGTYNIKLTVVDINSCVNSDIANFVALAHPLADFEYGPQPVSVLTPEVQFTNLSTPGLPHYNWNFGDIYSNNKDTSSLNNPMHTYFDVGTYSVTLTVSTANGCSATVVKEVIINEDYSLYVPNAFSPNGDGKNEIFKAVGEGIKDFELYVFDRWGLLLFYSDDIDKGWDGRKQGNSDIVQQDVYVWKINAKDVSGKLHNLNGTVTLLK